MRCKKKLMNKYHQLWMLLLADRCMALGGLFWNSAFQLPTQSRKLTCWYSARFRQKLCRLYCFRLRQTLKTIALKDLIVIVTREFKETLGPQIICLQYQVLMSKNWWKGYFTRTKCFLLSLLTPFVVLLWCPFFPNQCTLWTSFGLSLINIIFRTIKSILRTFTVYSYIIK